MASESNRSRPPSKRGSGSPGSPASAVTGPAHDSPVAALPRYLDGKPTWGRTTDAVSDALREAILDGALPPSTWLREDEIAAALQVSRTPVREALRRLSDEGLTVKTAHQGTVVAPMSLEDILALYVIRENLEGLAARLAALRPTPELIGRLDAVQAEMAKAAKRPNVERLAKQNIEFHRLIREAAGNHYLDRFLAQAEQAVRRLPPTTFARPGRPASAIEEHDAIVRAIQQGDPDAAEAAAKQHMRSAREIRLAVLLNT
ncbi:GntR family transcriptional regulator [Actinoalloteichus caeruleus]|uniref:GntR family transcriptional regulator n=1 Tax=Actinoalloteichus cyanogriseus TaxID=2893586 RepID=UPI001FDF9404|nr:GntR family transcriptional regulator [Actinoalloteichus caeruleus]